MKSKFSADIIASPEKQLKLYRIEKFEDGSGYSAKVDLVSGKFSCVGKTLNFHGLKEFYKTLDKGYETLSGSALLKHNYEQDNIVFKFTSSGHIIISGVFNEYSEEQSLEFRFETDQTFLSEFLRQIEKIIQEFQT